MAITFYKLDYIEHPEKKLRQALGVLVSQYPLDQAPKEADIVMDGLIEAVRRRKGCRCDK